MRWGLGLTAVLLLTVPAAFAKEKRLRPGQAYGRKTSGGVEYAVYIPKKWKRGKSRPLVVLLPGDRELPIDVVGGVAADERFAKYCVGGQAPFLCAVLLKAHNVESALWKGSVDVRRFLDLLERDVHSMDAVLDEVLRVLPVEPGAVLLEASTVAGETALGIAARRPDRFMCLVLYDVDTATFVQSPKPTWRVLPKGEALAPALDLPIVLNYGWDVTNLDARAQRARDQRDLLKGEGFRNLHLVEIDREKKYPDYVNPDVAALCVRIHADHRERRTRVSARDDLLAMARKAIERKSLEQALKAYRKARKLEVKHGLPNTSKTVYAALEAEGRRRLAACESLSESKRKAARRKLARLFEGLPLAEELK